MKQRLRTLGGWWLAWGELPWRRGPLVVGAVLTGARFLHRQRTGAGALTLSPPTAETHRANLFAKLECE